MLIGTDLFTYQSEEEYKEQIQEYWNDEKFDLKKRLI